MPAILKKITLTLIVDVKNTSERLYDSLFEELMGLFDSYTALYTPDFTALKYFISITAEGLQWPS